VPGDGVGIVAKKPDFDTSRLELNGKATPVARVRGRGAQRRFLVLRYILQRTLKP
jgi:hypothetical protein